MDGNGAPRLRERDAVDPNDGNESANDWSDEEENANSSRTATRLESFSSSDSTNRGGNALLHVVVPVTRNTMSSAAAVGVGGEREEEMV